MDRRDLRTMLRLFAEIASSVNEGKCASPPDLQDVAQGGEGYLPARDDEWAPSAAQS